MAKPQQSVACQKFKYFLVLDFEANCQEGSRLNPQEIIEFPCLLVDAKSHEIISSFHKYVKPVGIPELTPFCTQLTGITQDMIANEDTFPHVLEHFLNWYKENELNSTEACFVTCGLWDLSTMLPLQCSYSGMKECLS